MRARKKMTRGSFFLSPRGHALRANEDGGALALGGARAASAAVGLRQPHPRRQPYEKNSLLLYVFLRPSRACLGKTIVVMENG